MQPITALTCCLVQLTHALDIRNGLHSMSNSKSCCQRMVMSSLESPPSSVRPRVWHRNGLHPHVQPKTPWPSASATAFASRLPYAKQSQAEETGTWVCYCRLKQDPRPPGCWSQTRAPARLATARGGQWRNKQARAGTAVRGGTPSLAPCTPAGASFTSTTLPSTPMAMLRLPDPGRSASDPRRPPLTTHHNTCGVPGPDNALAI